MFSKYQIKILGYDENGSAREKHHGSSDWLIVALFKLWSAHRAGFRASLHMRPKERTLAA